jgi:hypothetical protein
MQGVQDYQVGITNLTEGSVYVTYEVQPPLSAPDGRFTKAEKKAIEQQIHTEGSVIFLPSFGPYTASKPKSSGGGGDEFYEVYYLFIFLVDFFT